MDIPGRIIGNSKEISGLECGFESHPGSKIINTMKLTVTELNDLMTKHIFLLSEDEVNAIALLLEIKISDFNKSKEFIQFKMTHIDTTVIVECFKDSNCSIGKHRKIKNSTRYGMMSWGGCFSIGKAILIFRNYFLFIYELSLAPKNKLEIYGEEECRSMVLLANDLAMKSY